LKMKTQPNQNQTPDETPDETPDRNQTLPRPIFSGKLQPKKKPPSRIYISKPILTALYVYVVNCGRSDILGEKEISKKVRSVLTFCLGKEVTGQINYSAQPGEMKSMLPQAIETVRKLINEKYDEQKFEMTDQEREENGPFYNNGNILGGVMVDGLTDEDYQRIEECFKDTLYFIPTESLGVLGLSREAKRENVVNTLRRRLATTKASTPTGMIMSCVIGNSGVCLIVDREGLKQAQQLPKPTELSQREATALYYASGREPPNPVRAQDLREIFTQIFPKHFCGATDIEDKENKINWAYPIELTSSVTEISTNNTFELKKDFSEKILKYTNKDLHKEIAAEDIACFTEGRDLTIMVFNGTSDKIEFVLNKNWDKNTPEKKEELKDKIAVIKSHNGISVCVMEGGKWKARLITDAKDIKNLNLLSFTKDGCTVYRNAVPHKVIETLRKVNMWPKKTCQIFKKESAVIVVADQDDIKHIGRMKTISMKVYSYMIQIAEMISDKEEKGLTKSGKSTGKKVPSGDGRFVALYLIKHNIITEDVSNIETIRDLEFMVQNPFNYHLPLIDARSIRNHFDDLIAKYGLPVTPEVAKAIKDSKLDKDPLVREIEKPTGDKLEKYYIVLSSTKKLEIEKAILHKIPVPAMQREAIKLAAAAQSRDAKAISSLGKAFNALGIETPFKSSFLEYPTDEKTDVEMKEDSVRQCNGALKEYALTNSQVLNFISDRNKELKVTPGRNPNPLNAQRIGKTEKGIEVYVVKSDSLKAAYLAVIPDCFRSSNPPHEVLREPRRHKIHTDYVVNSSEIKEGEEDQYTGVDTRQQASFREWQASKPGYVPLEDNMQPLELLQTRQAAKTLAQLEDAGAIFPRSSTATSAQPFRLTPLPSSVPEIKEVAVVQGESDKETSDPKPEVITLPEPLPLPQPVHKPRVVNSNSNSSSSSSITSSTTHATGSSISTNLSNIAGGYTDDEINESLDLNGSDSSLGSSSQSSSGFTLGGSSKSQFSSPTSGSVPLIPTIQTSTPPPTGTSQPWVGRTPNRSSLRLTPTPTLNTTLVGVPTPPLPPRSTRSRRDKNTAVLGQAPASIPTSTSTPTSASASVPPAPPSLLQALSNLTLLGQTATATSTPPPTSAPTSTLSSSSSSTSNLV
jgi:hypothetical protein